MIHLESINKMGARQINTFTVRCIGLIASLFLVVLARPWPQDTSNNQISPRPRPRIPWQQQQQQANNQIAQLFELIRPRPRPAEGSATGTSAIGAGSASVINGIVSATGQGVVQPGPCGFGIGLGIGIGVKTPLGNFAVGQGSGNANQGAIC